MLVFAICTAMSTGKQIPGRTTHDDYKDLVHRSACSGVSLRKRAARA